LETILVSGTEVGGQITLTREIENFPGFPEPISGFELMDRMRKQAENLGTKIISETITSVDFSKRPFTCKTENGDVFKAKSVIIATGARAKFLGLPNEQKLVGSGISVCATCDGFFYRGKDVAIVGGGNTALTDADLLAKLAKSVTIIHRSNGFRASKILVDKALKNKNLSVEYGAEIEELLFNEEPLGLTGLKIKNLETGKVKEIKADGLFVAIGRNPQTEMFEGQLDLDERGFIKTKEHSTATSVEGVFAAGDVQCPEFQQAITAAASGCKSALEADKFLCNCDRD
jgi:thioredoxin reductase (NADPH)